MGAGRFVQGQRLGHPGVGVSRRGASAAGHSGGVGGVDGASRRVRAGTAKVFGTEAIGCVLPRLAARFGADVGALWHPCVAVGG